MAVASSSDVAILALGVVLAAAYLFRDSIFSSSTPKAVPVAPSKLANGHGNPRDFIDLLSATPRNTTLRIDNAVQLMENLTDSAFEFSNGQHGLEGLKYVVFGLGNRTYEHYNAIARQVDDELTKMGAVRIGERGEGDDDKSMEEDYLEWKDNFWPAFAEALGVEEGQGGDTPDFAVTELESHPPEKVYLGELSARALTKTKGIHDAKNPYASPVKISRELFQVGGDRNCVHVELDIEGSGITYQHGDHVGVWPLNPDAEVDRLLCALGLYSKKDTVINVDSLDPALAKVPFPVPSTYISVLRHYIDISAVAGRQILGVLAKFAPSPEADAFMRNLTSNKDEYAAVVANGCLKLGEVLQLAAGNDINAHPTPQNTTAWAIPFDIVISSIPRLQPRYYSISSSPKLNPTSVHVTAVVLKYESIANKLVASRWVHGVGSNFLLNIKHAANGETAEASEGIEHVSLPAYAIEGPRGAHKAEDIYKIPVHVRRSTFRLPTNPKSPVIMVGPGTGVAPFRGFIQERVALARRTLEKNGDDALADWGQISLFYGCRKSTEDFLYKDEWPQYTAELKGKFTMHCAFSREPPYKPDGGKIYVQDLIWDDRKNIADAILNGKGYVYICGDAKAMSKAVEEVLARILGEAKGGSEAEGAAEIKLMKERSRLMLDVWS